MTQSILTTWTFEDNKNRGPLWYIIAFSIAIWLCIWWFLTKQYWMSFIVLLITWLTYYIDINSDDTIQVKVSTIGIHIWEAFYEYPKIHSFTIIYIDEQPIYLRLFLKKRWLNKTDIFINETIAAQLLEILPNYIQENDRWQMTNSEKIINKLKL